MSGLVVPHRRFHRSFLAAADEFVAAGEEQYAHLLDWAKDDTFAGIRFTREELESPATFGDFVEFLRAQREPHAPRPRDFVPCTELWIAEGATYLGRISLRHELTEVLFTWGGHIGYAVRPSARRQGHATAALAAMLEHCRQRRMDSVLVTCDTDNVASRRVIEVNGGVYEDSREGKRRYWVPTGRPAQP